MELVRHVMEPMDPKEYVERLYLRDPFVENMEIRHYQKVFKEITATGDEEQPILRRVDGTPFLLNVFGYGELQEIKPVFMAEEEGLLKKDSFEELLYMFTKRLVLSPLQFERIFQMIDLNQDEKISWDDFITFLNQEMKEREIMANGVLVDSIEPPIVGSPRYIRNNHGHLITSIAFWPTLTKDKKFDYSAGLFISTSKDGYVDFWNLDMKSSYSSTAFTPVPLKIASTCITKILPMPDIRMISLCTMDRELRIYDAVAESFRLRTVIREFRHGLVNMAYHYYDTDSIKSWLAVGDTQGNIFVLLFSPNAARTLFAQVVGLPFVSVRYSQIVMGFMAGLHTLQFPNVHPGWIESMEYYEVYKCLVTTCNSSTNSVVLINVHSSCILLKLNLPCGVTCAAPLSRDRYEPWAEMGVLTADTMQKKTFLYSHYLVTAGYDCDIRIWDLDIPSRPKFVIEGRTPRIVFVIVDEDGHMNPWIYAYAWEGVITVWDARTKSCLQEYKENLDRFGAHSQLSLCYNPYFKLLVVAAFKICCLKIGKTFNKDYTAGYCHEREITVALYNYLYDVIVTAGADSVITKWHAYTGVKVFSWSQAHSADILTEIKIYGITAGTFNPEQSLLATGAVDGSIKMWNFHTGTCLRQMEMARGAVLQVIWLKTRFFGIGLESSYREWEPTVTCKSKMTKELPKKWKRTATAACFVPPVTIIIGDVFGELLFCNYSSGKVYKRYYVQDPFKNLTMDVDYENEQKSTRNLVFDKRRHYNVGGVATTTIHFIYYLRKRPQERKEGNILVALDTGMIQVWSAHPRGGLVSAFYAVHKRDDFVVRVESDTNNDHVFTGTCEGYLKLWLIKNFATGDQAKISLPKLRLEYAFLAKTKWNTRARKAVVGQSAPLLLNSYRAHGMAISSIIFIDYCKLVITAGCDRSVRYWSMSGQFLNQLGSILPWITVDPSRMVVVTKLRIPPDLKRVMSSTTMQVLTNGYRLTEAGEVELVSTELKATAHIHRRKTSRKPHGQQLGSEIRKHLEIPDMTTKPAVPPPIDKQLDVLGRMKPYKMEKVEMIDVPKVLQPRIKKIFMNSLEYTGVPGYKKTGEMKKVREPTLIEKIKSKIKWEATYKRMQSMVEEDLHPYVYGCKIRDAVSQADNEVALAKMIEKGWKAKYFVEPQGRYLWWQKKFETDADHQLKKERMREMTLLLHEHNKKEAAKRLMMSDMERNRQYLSNNLLNRKVRLGRMRNTIDRLQKLERKQAKITGSEKDDEIKRKKITEKMDKLQVAAIHDYAIEHKLALGGDFWKPLYTSEESDIGNEDADVQQSVTEVDD